MKKAFSFKGNCRLFSLHTNFSSLFFSVFLGLLFMGSLFGCVTRSAINRTYCKGTDSYKLGRLDVSKGKTEMSFKEKLKKCSRYGVELDQKEYTRGREEELKTFCSYDKGYEYGVEGQKYKNICPKEIELVFLKGYKKGDKKCLYEAGYVDALNGRTSSFSSVKCLKLSADQSHKEYEKGQNAGLKVFCSYKVGYSFGLRNASYQNICPRNLETDFMKGYTLGLQEYKAEQRQREFLDIERQKIAVERERTQQLLSIERQKMAIEAERLRGEQSAREDFLHLQRLKRYQICRFDFDCHRGGICRYHFRLNNYVCRYD